MKKYFPNLDYFILIPALLFKITLDVASYKLIGSGGYGKFYEFDIFPERIFESYILFIIAVILLNYIISINITRPSKVLFVFYFLYLVTPILTIYSFRTQYASRQFTYMVIGCFFIAVFTVNFFRKFNFKIPGVEFSRTLYFIFGVSTLYVFASLIAKGGLSRFNFNLNEVYGVRSLLQEAAFPLSGYLVLWQAHVINIFIFVIGLSKRYKFFIIASIALQLLLFGMTNFKSFLFAPILVLFVYIFSNSADYLKWFLWLSLAVLLTTCLGYLYTNNIMFPSIFIRRLFLVPANLHYLYFDFFSQPNNSYVFLSNSIFSSFIEYPYDMNITRVISWNYLDRSAGLNVGYLGEAYAHFGFLGMAAFSLVLSFFLIVIDSISIKLPAGVASAIIALPSMALVNSGLFTTFLTHGFLLSICCLWVLTKSQSSNQLKSRYILS